MRYSTLCLLNNLRRSSKSLRISAKPASALINRRESLLRRPAQPVLQVLPDFRVAVEMVSLYDLLNHIIYYVDVETSGQ